MKIDHIETAHLCFQYPAGFAYAGGTCTARLTSLVFVHTDDGRCGMGSVYSHPGLVELVVKHQLEPFLIGRDPTEVEELWSLMYGLTRWFGRKGAAMSAVGGIDTALWDLRGQVAEKPIWQLLQGERKTCPAYASALLWQDVDQLTEEAGQLIDAGFRRVKMRLARNPEYDAAAIRGVRQAIGPQCDMMVDGSMRYDLPAARYIAKLLDEAGAFWFEEPFAPEDLDTFAQLRQETSVPLAAGENEFGAQGFRELVRTGSVDIVQPDASRCGGISEVRRAAELAQSANLQVATHSWSDALAIVANAHVMAAIPNGLTVEVDCTNNPFVKELLSEPLMIRDGELQLPTAPGLGVTLRPEVIDRYRLQNPLDVADGAYSDMVFGPQHYDPAAPYDSQSLPIS